MFNIGDIIIYSEHGLSRIDDICEKTFSNVTRTYYVLHPLDQTNLTISTPVDNEKVIMLEIMDRKEAEEIIESFKQPGSMWVEDPRHRHRRFKDIIKNGNRKEIANIANTLMRKNLELSLENKRLYDQDRKILEPIQNILFKELATSLDTSYEDIYEQVGKLIIE